MLEPYAPAGKNASRSPSLTSGSADVARKHVGRLVDVAGDVVAEHSWGKRPPYVDDLVRDGVVRRIDVHVLARVEPYPRDAGARLDGVHLGDEQASRCERIGAGLAGDRATERREMRLQQCRPCLGNKRALIALLPPAQPAAGVHDLHAREASRRARRAARTRPLAPPTPPPAAPSRRARGARRSPGRGQPRTVAAGTTSADGKPNLPFAVRELRILPVAGGDLGIDPEAEPRAASRRDCPARERGIRVEVHVDSCRCVRGEVAVRGHHRRHRDLVRSESRVEGQGHLAWRTWRRFRCRPRAAPRRARAGSGSPSSRSGCEMARRSRRARRATRESACGSCSHCKRRAAYRAVPRVWRCRGHRDAGRCRPRRARPHATTRARFALAYSCRIQRVEIWGWIHDDTVVPAQRVRNQIIGRVGLTSDFL